MAPPVTCHSVPHFHFQGFWPNISWHSVAIMIKCVTHLDLTLGHHWREQLRWINYPWKLCGPVPQLFMLLGVQFHVSVSFGLWEVAVIYLNVYLCHKCSPESHRASKSWCQIFLCFFGIYCWKITLPSYNMITLSTARCFVGLYISQILLFNISEIFLIFESLKQPGSSHVSGLSSYSTWRNLIVWRKQSPAITWIEWSASAPLYLWGCCGGHVPLNYDAKNMYISSVVILVSCVEVFIV